MDTVIMKVQTIECESGMSHSHVTNTAIVGGETKHSMLPMCVFAPTADHYETIESMILFSEAQSKALGLEFKLKQVV